MTEKLTNDEIQQLNDAFEDGFRDEYLPGSKMVKVDLGKLFETNPLNDEAVFYQASDPFDENMVRSATSSKNRDNDDLFGDMSWESSMFWGNPFGFNFEKVEAYFRTKQDEVIAEYAQRFEREIGELWSQGLYDDDGPNTFEQWIEGRIFPYTRRWFERHIAALCRGVRLEEKRLSEHLNSTADIPLPQFHLGRLVANAAKLGRMVEHYRWKFSHEELIVRRKDQSDRAGRGGAKSSSKKKVERLSVLMDEIEKLSSVVGLMSEDRILSEAFEQATLVRSDMPITQRTRFEYAVELRSVEPFKSRYGVVFRKST